MSQSRAGIEYESRNVSPPSLPIRVIGSQSVELTPLWAKNDPPSDRLPVGVEQDLAQASLGPDGTAHMGLMARFLD